MPDQQDIDEIKEEIGEAALVKQQLSVLVSDFRQLAAAELEYLKVRAAYSGQLAKRISIFVAIALFALLSALVGLVLGLLLVTAQFVGAIAATIIVVACFVLLALLSALAAKRNARKLTFEAEEDDG